MHREGRLPRRTTGRVALDDFESGFSDIQAPAAGEVPVRNSRPSVDPSVRHRLAAVVPRGYLPPFDINHVLGGLAIGEVVESRADGFAAGDLVRHAFGYREYDVVPAAADALARAGRLRKVDVSLSPARVFLGALGQSGLTAYAALVRVGALQPHDLAWVSAGKSPSQPAPRRSASVRPHRCTTRGCVPRLKATASWSPSCPLLCRSVPRAPRWSTPRCQRPPECDR